MANGTRALTLTLGSGATNLLTAIQAVSGYANAQDGCTFINVRGDDSLGGSSYIYLGDANVTSSSYGSRLGAGVSLPIAPGSPYSCNLSSLHVLGSAGGLKCNVLWIESV
jgi:hypothetical protein